MNRRTILILTVCVIAIAIAFVAINASAAGQEQQEFGQGNYDTVTTALTDVGLDVAEENFSAGGDVTGSYEKMTYSVATRSNASDGLVVVNAYAGPEQLDEIGEDSYVGDSLIGYRWQQYIVSITQSSDPVVIAAFRQAMGELDGASVAYDHLG